MRARISPDWYLTVSGVSGERHPTPKLHAFTYRKSLKRDELVLLFIPRILY